MDIVKRDRFTALWKKYFNDAELPVAFYYSKENNNATIVKKAVGHTCIIAQLGRVRKGEPLCFLPDSVGCGGGKYYLGFVKGSSIFCHTGRTSLIVSAINVHRNK